MADENTVIYEIRENVVEIKTTLTSIVQNVDLKFQVQEEKIKVANNRIKDLEDTIKWLWRAISGAKYSLVAQQYPFSLHNAVISPYNNLALGVIFISYLTVAGIIA